jgi:hypothetical protein
MGAETALAEGDGHLATGSGRAGLREEWIGWDWPRGAKGRVEVCEGYGPRWVKGMGRGGGEGDGPREAKGPGRGGEWAGRGSEGDGSREAKGTGREGRRVRAEGAKGAGRGR